MVTDSTVHAEDVIPVRSRITWGAIIAGSVLAISLYFLLALLGGAMGLSISDKVNPQDLGTGAAIYAIIVTVLCLFVGGYVASQLTTGENKIEGALYGIFVWAAVFAVLVVLMTSGMRLGFNAIVGVATAGKAAADNTKQSDWEASARQQLGVSQQQLDEWKQKAKDAPASARQAVEDPQNQQAAANAATRATWYAFFGAWLSMMAAAAGGYFGSGPTFRLAAVSLDRRSATGRPVTVQ